MWKSLRSLGSEEIAWGGGPLLFMCFAGYRAVRAPGSTERWIWIIVAANMFLLCAIFLIWNARRSARATDATAAGPVSEPADRPD